MFAFDPKYCETLNKRTIDASHLLALKSAGKMNDDQGNKVIDPTFDAAYHERNGQDYPAHIHIPNSREPGERVWLDKQGKVKLFMVAETLLQEEVQTFFTIVEQPGGGQLQHPCPAPTRYDDPKDWNDTDRLMKELTASKVVLYMPEGLAGLNAPRVAPGHIVQRYELAIKVPVVDMLVDFGSRATGPRIVPVHGIRHASKAMGLNIPCYFEYKWRVVETNELKIKN